MNKPTGLIVGSAHEAIVVQRTLDPRHVFVLYPGQMVAGRRFAYLLVTDFARSKIEETEQTRQWYRNVVLTSLMPDSRIVYL